MPGSIKLHSLHTGWWVIFKLTAISEECWCNEWDGRFIL